MGSILGAIATLIVIVIGAAFAVPYAVDWNAHRGVFEEQAARVIGRKVSVAGDMRVTLLPAPRMSFKSVRIAGADGGFTTPFAEVKSFDMTLSLSALLSGNIEANSVTLGSPVLRLKAGADGAGDWRDVGASDPSLPIAPRGVTLNAVAIKDGRVEIANEMTRSAWRIEAITGEFSAETLNGPFKFGGVAAVNGHVHDIRLSAGRLAAGKLRLKAAARAIRDDGAYQFDGDLSGFDGPMTFSGAASYKTSFLAPGDDAKRYSLEAKAQTLIAPDQLRLDGLSGSVAAEGRPQNFSGEALLAWGASPRFDADIRAEWADGAMLAAALGADASLDAAPALIARLNAILPVPVENGRIKAAAAQIALGGDTLQNAEIIIDQRGGAVDAVSFKTAAPGDSVISVSGRIDPAGGEFSGKAELSGANMGRFIRWASRRPERAGLAASTQNYALRGDLALSGGVWRLGAAAGELGDSSFTGGLEYGAGEDAALTLTLDSDRLDLRPALGEEFTLGAAAPSAPGGAPQTKAITAQGLAAQILALKTSKINLRIGQLDLPGQALRDVSAAVQTGGGTIDIAALRAASDQGLRIEASGTLKSLETAPEGDVKLSVEAAGADAVAALAAAMGVPPNETGARRMPAFAPLKIAGNVSARGAEKTVDFRLDGLAAASQFSFAGRFAGDRGKFWDGDLDAEGWLSNENGAALLQQLFPDSDASAKAGGKGRGNLTASLNGPLNAWLKTKLTLQTAGMAAGFDGEASIMKAPWEGKGAISIVSRDSAATSALLGFLPGGKTAHGPLLLEAGLVKTGSVYTLSGLNLNLDGFQASGKAAIDAAAGAPSVALTLDAANASLAPVYAILLSSSRQEAGNGQEAGEALTAEAGGAWPERTFSASFFEGPRQSIELKARTLSLGGGLVLQDASLNAALERGKLNLGKLEGKLYGGKFSAQGSLQKQRGKYDLAARASIGDARLESVMRGASAVKPLASGPVSIDLRISGEGYSPRGIASVLSGRGNLTFGQGTLYGIAPGAPQLFLQAQIDAAKPPEGSAAKSLSIMARQGDFAFRRLRAPLTIKNGALRIRRASFRGADYILRADMTVDLVSLAADSEWRLGAATDRRKPQIPPVKLIFAGPLAELRSLKGEIDASELEQFIAVRRMERDVERLEKLNQPGRLPPADADADKPAAGPRRDNRNAPSGPAAQGAPQRPSSSVERQMLPPLQGAPAAKTNADGFSGWKPSAAPPPPQEKAPGAFEAKIRPYLKNPDAPPAGAAPRTAPETGSGALSPYGRY